MAERFNQLPKPDPVWIALGIVAASMAISLPAKRRAAFLDALRAVTDAHENHDRIVAFGLRRNHNREMANSIRGGVAWMRRLIVELETPEGS